MKSCIPEIRFFKAPFVYCRSTVGTNVCREFLPKRIVSVKDSPSGLKHRVEQAVPGRSVPQSVQAGAEPGHELQTHPVDDGVVRLELLLRVFVQ